MNTQTEPTATDENNDSATGPIVIRLNAEETNRLMADIENPPPPNAELKEAWALYKREIAREGMTINPQTQPTALAVAHERVERIKLVCEYEDVSAWIAWLAANRYRVVYQLPSTCQRENVKIYDTYDFVAEREIA